MASFTFSGGRIVFIDMRCVYVVNSFATGKIENTNQIENAQFSHTFVLSIRRRFIYRQRTHSHEWVMLIAINHPKKHTQNEFYQCESERSSERARSRSCFVWIQLHFRNESDPI